MFRRRLTLVLALFAAVTTLAALLAAASLAVTERQVLRGRVASDIATGFIQLSAQKQRLRTWVAQMQQDANADAAARADLLAAMQGTLGRLKVLTQQAIELDGSVEAREEHLRRSETLAVLQQGMAVLARAAENAAPLAPGADAVRAWEALSRAFDTPQGPEGRDVRALIAENIAREAAAVQRERAATDSTLAGVRWLWLAAAMLLVAVAVGAAWHFGRALRDPLQRLSEGARLLESGQLSHRISLAGDDEFSEVARSVNGLAAELERRRELESARRQRLEDQVAARTRELADALASLRQADDQRRRLFADVSHELRTPTTVVLGEAEIALRGVDKPADEYKLALRRIAETARQLGTVIDDLLAMARNDTQALSLVREPVDIDELATDVLAQAAVLAERQGVTLGAPPARTGAHVVSGDPMRLRQLLGVLLDNATRYSRAGGRVDLSVETVAATADEPAGVKLSVVDQGIGIAAHELGHVFERHFRGAEARRHSPDGSGLGLPIARSLAQAHGGRLQVRSNGQGTQCELILPLLASAAPAPQVAA